MIFAVVETWSTQSGWIKFTEHKPSVCGFQTKHRPESRTKLKATAQAARTKGWWYILVTAGTGRCLGATHISGWYRFVIRRRLANKYQQRTKTGREPGNDCFLFGQDTPILSWRLNNFHQNCQNQLQVEALNDWSHNLLATWPGQN